MDASEFRRAGKEMIDYVADYLENIRDRQVTPDVKQGYLRKLIPDAAPETAEPWDAVLSDVERVIMPGVAHWHSPRFHAYFPTGNSYPAILGDILSDAIGCIGFSWTASPACTELETVMMDWLAKLLGLPDHFLFSSKGLGGGVIQGTASEACFVALLAAKAKAIRDAKIQHPDWTDGQITDKLIAYNSEHAHQAADRAALLAHIKCRGLPSDSDLTLRGAALAHAIEEDKAAGLIPFYVLASLGTTGHCAFDNLTELGPICQAENLWLHVDAAYAGSAFICPEFRHYLAGVEYADSFNFNPHKWLLVNFDCSALWLKNTSLLTSAVQYDCPIILDSPESEQPMPDYRHWQVALGRRFRSLKLWFVLRLFGLDGLQKHIRTQVGLAKEFEKLVDQDDRFEIAVPVRLGLVCFRLKAPGTANERFLKKINQTKKLFMTQATVNGSAVIRFTVCASRTNSEDVLHSWKIIQDVATEFLDEEKARTKLKMPSLAAYIQ
ncbi:Aromatic-L-amino-acid decarboxylase [Hypsibius exemplaris]|uniref:Aromatic-L-amino-acid decarboxylase n=1 Tax=Hypsibius exemplaris TaxID=2072580 RepID=A0A1W0X856_HYPEX|nr:Aromatic-L-amino-acid decarboxylase [Hypsibius exemplaris]